VAGPRAGRHPADHRRASNRRQRGFDQRQGVGGRSVALAPLDRDAVAADQTQDPAPDRRQLRVSAIVITRFGIVISRFGS
jgi:hypothetical protein